MFFLSTFALKQFFILFYAAHAQVVTSSFDPTIIGENPASAATRMFGVVTPFMSYTQVDQEIQETASGESFDWNRNLKIQRYEAIFAGKKARFVPEIYISQNYGTKETQSNSNQSKTKNHVDMLNNHLNLGFSVNESIKLGAKFFMPSMAYKTDERYTLSDSTVRTYNSDFSYTETGTGGGITLLLTKNFSIGGFYTSVYEKLKGKSEYKEGSNATETSNFNGSTKIVQNGGGLAYQIGDVKSKGFRVELSWASMKFSGENAPKNNSQGRISIEASRFGFNGGITITQTTGNYINYRYFIDSVLSEEESTRPILSYGGFFGLKTKSGSSFGGSANYSSGKGKVSLFDSEQPGKITRLYVGLSYAYYF